jgi:hypothetical protein
MTGYTPPRKPTPGEIEDQQWVSQGSGRSIISAEEWPEER